MSFKLSGGSPTVEVSASAWISSQTDTTATITVQANSWMVYSGSWVQSSGVVAKATGNGSGLGTKTIFGNGTYASGTSTHSVTFSFTVSKDTSSKSVSWSVAFHSYVDGTDLGSKDSRSGSISIGAKTSYTVSYNANGGSGAPSSQTKWYGTNLTLSSTKPTRTGYSFQGWGTSASDTSVDYAAGATYSKNAGATLYAIWKANTYAVKYDANGGTGAPSQQTKTYGVDLTLFSTKPTRTNYNFLGWGTSASATTVSYAAGATYKNNVAITLYAVWELAYWKPKITNLSVSRCTSDGTADEFGTCAKVMFNWELCQLCGINNISSITIVCDSVTTTVSASGTSGSVSQIIGTDALSIESSYTVEVTVTDTIQSGSTSSSKTLAGSSFTMDFLAGGKGVAFGKPAETENAIETPWAMKSSYVDVAFRHIHSTTGNHAYFGIGSGGNNRGIWVKNSGDTSGRWLIYTNNTNDTLLNGVNPDGEIRGLVRLNSSNNLHVGHGSYDNSDGQVYYSGNRVAIRSKSGVYITDTTSGLSNRAYGVNKVLWSGGSYMSDTQTATLSEKISAQPHGIVLVWGEYKNGNEDSGWSYFFVPKQCVDPTRAGGTNFATTHYGNTCLMSKYVYIRDTNIVGWYYNAQTSDGTANTSFVLRYVIGV